MTLLIPRAHFRRQVLIRRAAPVPVLSLAAAVVRAIPRPHCQPYPRVWRFAASPTRAGHRVDQPCFSYACVPDGRSFPVRGCRAAAGGVGARECARARASPTLFDFSLLGPAPKSVIGLSKPEGSCRLSIRAHHRTRRHAVFDLFWQYYTHCALCSSALACDRSGATRCTAARPAGYSPARAPGMPRGLGQSPRAPCAARAARARARVGASGRRVRLTMIL